MFNKLNGKGKKLDMKINVGNTKIMKFTQTPNDDFHLQIKIEGETVETVKGLRYLGALSTNDGRDIKKIRSRVGMAKQAFTNL